ncbi:hypothetical protein V8G61_03170 [Gaetbulibacter sp. M240]|uniref:hypothetical protein n=1 Tax=Gaetbulibacter sp. M240 TaxID=3126511 RepID=UPI00374F423B
MENYAEKELLNQPKKPDWEHVHKLMEHLKSNLEFYYLDLNSLESLIDYYFSKLVAKENLDELRELQQGVLELKNQCYYLKNRLRSYEKRKEILENLPVLNDENKTLEDEIQKFINEENELEKVIFSMIQEVLGNDTADTVILN